MEKREEFVTSDAHSTKITGLNFSKKLEVGNIIVLTGELGAGKTTFVQGIASGINVKSRIISPTFVLVRKHKGKLGGKKINLYHIDLYRLEGTSDINSLGIEDIFEDVNGIFLIEWGERHVGIKANYEVRIEIIDSEVRKISIYE